MKRTLLAAAIALAAGAAQAQVVLYKSQNFRGPAQQVRGEVAHLEGGFDGQASSLVIEHGTWQFCTGDHFTGRCKVLTPGRYPTLAWMDDRVTSIKWLGDNGVDVARYDTWNKRDAYSADRRDDRRDSRDAREWRDRDAASSSRQDDRRFDANDRRSDPTDRRFDSNDHR
jgi:hypothetical protein